MIAALELQSLTKSYHAGLSGCAASARVLECVDLRLTAGEVVGIAGEEGAGKTTLLLCAAGLLRPDRGRVRWFGGDTGRVGESESPVVFVGGASPAPPRRSPRERAAARRGAGETRRFQSAARPPRLILADDPPLLRGARPGSGFVRLLADYAAAGGAVLLTARDPVALAMVATRILLLHDGRLVASEARRLHGAIAER